MTAAERRGDEEDADYNEKGNERAWLSFTVYLVHSLLVEQPEIK